MSLGHRNGYVVLPKGHKYDGKDYNEIDVEVHGGLTFASRGIYEKYSDQWVLGFDCAHYGDGKDKGLIEKLNIKEVDATILEMTKMFTMTEGTIKTTRFVEIELRRLVEQL